MHKQTEAIFLASMKEIKLILGKSKDKKITVMYNPTFDFTLLTAIIWNFL